MYRIDDQGMEGRPQGAESSELVDDSAIYAVDVVARGDEAVDGFLTLGHPHVSNRAPPPAQPRLGHQAHVIGADLARAAPSSDSPEAMGRTRQDDAATTSANSKRRTGGCLRILTIATGVQRKLGGWYASTVWPTRKSPIAIEPPRPAATRALAGKHAAFAVGGRGISILSAGNLR